MRIVHLIQSAAQIYGAERCVLLETLAQKPRRREVRALICHETRMGEGAQRLEEELGKLAIPVDRVLATGQVSLRLLYDLGRALRRLRPDVVHSHSMKTDVLAVPVARLLRIPLVIELHGYLHPKDDARVRLYERLDQWMMRHSDGVLVLSRDYQRKVVGYGVPSVRVHLVPSGIDVVGLRAQVGRRELRGELGLPPRGAGPPVVGMVARLSSEKGHEHFLRAVAALRERGMPVLAVLFGEGPLRAELERQVAALGLGDVVRLAGYVPEVADAYRCLDVLVSCSQIEGLPLNLIEAMALGVPVVAMAAGGCVDIVHDASTGRLVPLGDGVALAQALAELCGDAELRQRLGEAAARSAEQRYSLEAWAAGAEAAYAAARAVRPESELMARRGGLAIVTAGALSLLLTGTATAGRLDFGGEVRADVNLGFGSTGQFGTLDGNGPCGYNPSTDGGGDLSATVAALLSSTRYRHQLTLSLGYYALYCTPLLRRPVGGFDYRSEHALSERTRLQATARYTFDVFDRSFDALSGSFTPGVPTSGAGPSGESAGLPYLIGQASVELTHAFSKLYGLRAGVQLHSLEVLGALNQLPYYSTLGPMEAVTFHATAARDAPRSRFELGLRYRVSAFYSATWLSIRQRGQVPAAHDAQLAPAWEYKLSPKLTLHVEAGAAVAVQPHLCVPLDDLLIAADRCSIDARAPGIRGYDGAPPLEAPLGRVGTLTPVGELSLSYSAPRRRFELHLVRGYEPDAYAGALSLFERLSGNLHWRPLWPLLLHGNAQLVHSAQTSPARVSPALDGLLLQPLSPQNRTLWMAMGLLGVDYRVLGPLSVYFETTFQALKIRGERVPQIPSQGASFTADLMAFPAGTNYQDIYRVNLLLGVRGYLDTLPSARREAELFTETRAVP